MAKKPAPRRIAPALLCAVVVCAGLDARAEEGSHQHLPTAAEAAEVAALAELRQIEGRLSVGHELTAGERALLVSEVKNGITPRVRALAAAILPWLPPAESAEPLFIAMGDEDPRVREQAAQGLVALSRRMSDEVRGRAAAAATTALDDPAAEVSCAAARLLAAADPDAVRTEVAKRAAKTEAVRYACWSRVVRLPERRVEAPAPARPKPPEPERPATTPDAEETPAAAAAAPTGDLIFITTAAATGLLAGAVLPGIPRPPRDVLTYTPRRSLYAREEVAFAFAAGTGHM
jgi:hypothetical protein